MAAANIAGRRPSLETATQVAALLLITIGAVWIGSSLVGSASSNSAAHTTAAVVVVDTPIAPSVLSHTTTISSQQTNPPHAPHMSVASPLLSVTAVQQRVPLSPMENVVMALHGKYCAARGSLLSSKSDPTYMVKVVDSNSTRHVGWSRVLLRVFGKEAMHKFDHGALCSGGDGIHVRVESPTGKVAVRRILDRDDGLYETQMYFRVPGVYMVCGAVSQSWRYREKERLWIVHHSNATWFDTPADRRHPPVNWLEPLKTGFEGIMPQDPRRLQMCPMDRPPVNTNCVNITVEGTMRSVVAVTSNCTAESLVPGHWRRLESDACGDTCTGDLANLGADRDPGWMWESDACRLHLFSRDEAWSLIRGKWILAWGDSTLKQPLSNWIEYFLGAPLFENNSITQAGKSLFFAYRNYDVTIPSVGRDASCRFTMAWAGCPNVAVGPKFCRSTEIAGFNTKQLLEAVRGQHPPVKTFKAVPDVILLNHFIWRKPRGDETQFVQMVSHSLETLLKLYSGQLEALGDNRSHRLPLVLYVTVPKSIFSDENRPCAGTTPSPLVDDILNDRVIRIIDSFRKEKAPLPFKLEVLDRTSLTWPFHFDERVVHLGYHYGASPNMCAAGVAHNPEHYGATKCVRRTFVDTMLMHWWMNAIRTHYL